MAFLVTWIPNCKEISNELICIRVLEMGRPWIFTKLQTLDTPLISFAATGKAHYKPLVRPVSHHTTYLGH